MREYGDVACWEQRLESQVWYSRHKLREEAIGASRLLVIDKQRIPLVSSQILPEDSWKRASAYARQVEVELAGDLGPWSDYEWGKINGKLSALRWVLGLDWDMLDT